MDFSNEAPVVTPTPTPPPPPSDPLLDEDAPEVLPELPEAMRGRYKVEAELGEGAFGITLLVKDKVSNEKYVAKIMDLTQMTPEG